MRDENAGGLGLSQRCDAHVQCTFPAICLERQHGAKGLCRGLGARVDAQRRLTADARKLVAKVELQRYDEHHDGHSRRHRHKTDLVREQRQDGEHHDRGHSSEVHHGCEVVEPLAVGGDQRRDVWRRRLVRRPATERAGRDVEQVRMQHARHADA